MDDVLRQLVLAGRDPHLVAEQAVRTVVLRHGTGRDIGRRGAGLRLGQAHRAVEAALDHGLDVGFHQLRRAVRLQQVGVAEGQERVARRPDVRGLEPQEAGPGHDRRQLHPADGLVHGAAMSPVRPKTERACPTSGMGWTRWPSKVGSLLSAVRLCGAKCRVATCSDSSSTASKVSREGSANQFRLVSSSTSSHSYSMKSRSRRDSSSDGTPPSLGPIPFSLAYTGVVWWYASCWVEEAGLGSSPVGPGVCGCADVGLPAGAGR